MLALLMLITGFKPFLCAEPAADINLSNLTIPQKFGYVSKTFSKDQSNKTIFYIQDLHSDYTAQKNLAGIIEQLMKDKGVKVVLVEGGSGDDSLAYMRSYAAKDKIKEVAERYLKNGDISGEEYLNLVSDMDFKILGIENPALYDNHMRSFLEIRSIKEPSLKITEEFIKLEDKLKENVYTDKVKELESRARRFARGDISLADYIDALAGSAKSAGIDYFASAQFNDALKLVGIERTLALDKVEIERAQLIESLVNSAPKETTDRISQMAAEFRDNKISAQKFYAALKSAAIDNNIDLAKYPALFKYLNYMELSANLSQDILFDDIAAIEDKLREKLFTQEDEKKLYSISKETAMLKKLIDTRLRPSEYEFFKADKQNINLNDWALFLNGLALKYNLGVQITSDNSLIQDNLYVFENYYVMAKERDSALALNIEKRMTEEGINEAVVVAGGFHAEALLDLLKERGFSYALISPNIGNDPNTKDIYVNKLIEKWNPGEWKTKGEAPAPPPESEE